ncbi:hypothetical protein BGZ65_004210 [Modicella reniformis]|uniref:Inositol polyphosphate-related phosphatase domain-containing protein n=1 Tax=Modicella reniformis TaxID=1440133 RepID=A0A9P6IZ81_9FUNG|nr:hypothetical protein BGZ65_004210 [Modicella reniformis]
MVVVQICQEMADTVKLCGPGIVADHIGPIAEHLKLIFEKKAYCQQELADDEGLLDEDEQAEFDALLISAASDLVGALAGVLGVSFIPYAQVFIPHIAKYYKKSKPSNERSMAIGCLGEIANGMGSSVTEFTEQLLTLFVKALGDEEDEVCSNAAFAIGALCQNTTVDMSSQYPSLLTALYPLFQGQSLPNVTDNACGAVARMTMKHPTAVPLDQVLPVFVQALPLKRDFEENEAVYRLLFQLIRSQNEWVGNNIARLLTVFAEVLVKPDELKPQTRQEMIEIVKGLNQQFPALNIKESPLAENGKQEHRILAIIVNTQAGVEESCVFILRRTGQMTAAIQTVLPIYFDFRISVAQTKPVDKDDKQSIQDSKNDFTLKLFCDQTEVSVQTDDLETLQGLLRELRGSHLIAQDDNFYAGGSSHRWVQYYTIEEDPKVPGTTQESVMTMDEFIVSTSNPLTMYFLQPEDSQPRLPSAGPRLELGKVKESWIEKEMRSRESSFTEYSHMHAFVGTWNVNGRNPTTKLDSWLKVEGDVQPDIYVICFQELDLSAEAYIVLDAAKEEEWTQVISESLGAGYHKIISKQLVGLLIIMYVAEDHANYVKEVTVDSAGVGMLGMLGNKGGVSIRIRYKDSYLCFVDSHLAHDINQVERRNQDYQEICRRLTFPSMNPYDITKSPAGNAALAVANKVSIFESE